MVTGSRESTTVPAQALFMLNDPLVRDSSVRIAKSIASTSEDAESIIHRVYRQVLQRSPTIQEHRLAESFLMDYRKMLAEYQSQTGSSSDTSSSDNQAVSDAIQSANANDAAPEDSRPAEILTQSIVEETATDENIQALAVLVQSLIASAEFRYVP
jgi:hypothetical protein